MKFVSVSVLASLASSALAFAPPAQRAAFVVQSDGSSVVSRLASHALASTKNPDDMTLEEEIEEMVQKEMAKTKKASRLKTASGQEYAPWMKITEEDENRIRQVMKERAEARRKRREQEERVTGSLYLDSAFQELSGTGLKYKVVDGENVELEWATMSEKDTKGFIVKRRPAKTEDFSVVASFEEWGPLKSKGPEGGVYRYLDTDVAPGGWVYRISECDTSGNENDISQCLVELQTKEEQRNTLIAAVGFGAVAIAILAAGLLLDPIQ